MGTQLLSFNPCRLILSTGTIYLRMIHTICVLQTCKITMTSSCGYITFRMEIRINTEYPVHDTDQHKYELVVQDAVYWSMSEEIYNLYTIWLANEQRLPFPFIHIYVLHFHFIPDDFVFLYSKHLEKWIISVLPSIINSIVHSYSSVYILFYVLFPDISTRTHIYISLYMGYISTISVACCSLFYQLAPCVGASNYCHSVCGVAWYMPVLD